MRDDGRAHDGCAIRRLGGGPSKVNAFITLGDGFEEDGGSDFYSVCAGVRRESALTGCASHLPMGGFGSHLVFR